MGTVYRQKGRKIWMLKYRRDGQRRPIVQSSGTENKTEAKSSQLRDIETDIHRGLPITPKVGTLRFEEAAADVVNEYKVNNRRSLDELERRFKLAAAVDDVRDVHELVLERRPRPRSWSGGQP
jgi:hypothetical protein